ncbi:MAG: CBS domain-containing protein [Comamonadaceae bacterium]|jgi:CBS domain-containing protein|nr:MAG: CBS domain-containing protein [Comamonadaceae bacterium]
MFSQTIKNVMDPNRFLTAAPDQTVSDASSMMQTRNVGAVLVIADGKLMGIFTERDAVFRVIAKGLDPTTTRLADVMTVEPITLSPEKSYGHALLLMQENGFRHVPVVQNGVPIGIISSRNAMDPEMEQFVWEERRRVHYR